MNIRNHNFWHMNLLFFIVFTTTLLLEAAATHAQIMTSPPIVNATTFAVVRIDPARTNLPEWIENDSSSQIHRATTSLRVVLQKLRVISPQDDVYLALDVPYGSHYPSARMVFRNRPEIKNALTEQFRVENPLVQGDYVSFSLNANVAVTPLPLDEEVLSSRRLHFAPPTDVTKGFPIQILIATPDYVQETLDETLPRLPSQLGGGPTSVLTRGLQWASVGIDPSQVKMMATIQSRSNADATALTEYSPALLSSIANLLEEPKHELAATIIQALVATSDVTVNGDQINVQFTGLGDKDAALLLLSSISQTILGPVSRDEQRSQFKQLVLGLLNYESANSVFPPNEKEREEDGKSRLSWRVHILPFLGDDELYGKFRRDEPWDSPHNKALLAEMPDVFNSRSRFTDEPKLPPGYTTYLAPVGERTLMGGHEPIRVGDVRDGTSMTLVVVRVKPELAVPWTAPRDYAYDVNAPAAGIAFDDEVTLGGFCDGHVQELTQTISRVTWLRLFDIADGELIDLGDE